MREIKFRAWDESLGQMCQILVLDMNGGDETLLQPLAPDPDWPNEFAKEPYWQEPRCLKLREYTGLHDRNGEEIYEGDIVKTSWGTGKIIYEGDAFTIYLGCARGLPDGSFRNFIEYKDNWETWEVIGNIYENGELVEG